MIGQIVEALRDLAPADQALRHLDAVLPTPLLPGEAVEIRCLDTRVKPAGKGPRYFVTALDQAVEIAMRHRGDWDVFVGVASRRCPDGGEMAECRHSEKGRDHVSRLQCIWGDFDVQGGSEDEFDRLVERLETLALPPTTLVASGRGIHSYWRLDSPTIDAKRIEAINRSLRLRLGADNAVDATRILRIAGTLNHKYSEPLPVRLLRTSDDLHA